MRKIFALLILSAALFSCSEQKGPSAVIITDPYEDINWESVFAAVRECDIDYAFVEQDKAYGEDPFDCLARSLAFIRSHGFAD